MNEEKVIRFCDWDQKSRHPDSCSEERNPQDAKVIIMPSVAPIVRNAVTCIIALAAMVISAAAQYPQVGAITGNPSSVLTRPANTTAYSSNQLVGSNVTNTSVVVPTFNAVRVPAGSGQAFRFRLVANQTSGMGSATFLMEFWTCAPTFTNGDGGTYAVATGSACWLGSCSISTMTQVGDGAYGACTPAVGSLIGMKLASGQAIYWSLEATAGYTPISAGTYTLIADMWQDQ